MTFLIYGLLGVMVVMAYRFVRVRYFPDLVYSADKAEKDGRDPNSPIRRIRLHTAL